MLCTIERRNVGTQQTPVVRNSYCNLLWETWEMRITVERHSRGTREMRAIMRGVRIYWGIKGKTSGENFFLINEWKIDNHFKPILLGWPFQLASLRLWTTPTLTLSAWWRTHTPLRIASGVYLRDDINKHMTSRIKIIDLLNDYAGGNVIRKNGKQ